MTAETLLIPKKGVRGNYTDGGKYARGCQEPSLLIQFKYFGSDG